MAESTRIGFAGNVEIHLKKRVEITSEIVNQVNTLPDNSNWFVLGKNTNTGNWTFEQSFNDFELADERFVTLSRNNGLGNADRLLAGKRSGGTGREVR